MCRHSQNPALGSWAIPGGFLEYGETLQQGAARETFEETRVLIKPDALQLYAVMSITAIHQVIASFRIKLAAKPELRSGQFCIHLMSIGFEGQPFHNCAYKLRRARPLR
jgi:ADP-ribose pyrophosphatase YjhB (NUDIX family)